MGSAVGSALRAASDRLSSSRRLAGDRDRSLHTAPTEHSETQKRWDDEPEASRNHKLLSCKQRHSQIEVVAAPRSRA